jgi:hypothetical protein
MHAGATLVLNSVNRNVLLSMFLFRDLAIFNFDKVVNSIPHVGGDIYI